jgi:pilus assembly protein CpaE
MSAADEILHSRLADQTAVKALVAIDGDVDRELVETLMTEGQGVEVVDYIDLAGEIQAHKLSGGDVLIVATSDYTPATARTVRFVRNSYPARPIVLLSRATTDGFVTQAFNDGVDDMLAIPEPVDPEAIPALVRELTFTIDKALARKRGTSPTTRQTLGRMICVLGLKGGSGKTLVTANLGVALAAAGHSVALVDLDLQFGDLGLMLGVMPDRSLYDLVRSGGALDGEKLRDFLVTHPSGVDLLLSPVRPDQASLVTPDFLRGVFRVLRETHEYVVIDTPPQFTSEVIGAVDASTDVVMVAMLDSLALKNTKLGLETLDRLEYDRRRVRLVLNRANSDVGISSADVRGILEKQPDVKLPSHREISRSVNRGEPVALAKRSEAARAFKELARLYEEDADALDITPVASTRRQPRWLRRR